MGYRIREWEKRYEVNDKNRALKPEDRMRQGELEYLRFPVHGRNHSAAYRRFLREAKDDAPMTYGVYVKLKEIAAQAEAGKRGVIRNDAGQPIEDEEIAECMGFPVKCVKRALEILCRESVGWVEQFREVPGNPGNSPSYTETETESYTETETKTESASLPPLGSSGCPLIKLPDLTGSYASIREKLLEVHPHAKLPEPGSAKEFADRQELERIVRIDGYSEEAVIDTLAYVLMDEPHNDRFMWRDQFRSFSGLRKVNDGATKFSRMHDAMQKFREANIRAVAETHYE